jgi:hypothetical protein
MVRTLHCDSTVVATDDVELGEGLGDEPDAPSGAVVDVVAMVVEVWAVELELEDPEEVVVLNGATARGASSPTCESARPTICQVRTVVRTSARSHAAAMRHEIMP